MRVQNLCAEEADNIVHCFSEIPFRCENWEQMVKHMACGMFLKAVVSLIHAEKVKVGLGYEKT
jgi:hypothetical protein